MSEPALKVVNVSKRFGGLAAITNVSLDVPDGSVTALIGPNGAGKTTLFNLITNLITATEGTFYFHGMSLDGRSPRQIAALGLIRTFQTARAFPRWMKAWRKIRDSCLAPIARAYSKFPPTRAPISPSPSSRMTRCSRATRSSPWGAAGSSKELPRRCGGVFPN